MQPVFSPWSWRDPAILGGYSDTADPSTEGREVDSAGPDDRWAPDLTGYDVEATDGGIGTVDEVGEAHLIVDTGRWIFGRKVLLPVGTVQRVDHTARKVLVDRTKDQVKDSPEYDPESFGTDDYRDRVGTYYTGTYRDAPPPL